MMVYYDGLLLLEWIILCLKELAIVVRHRHKPNKEVNDYGAYIAVLNILISLWKSTDYYRGRLLLLANMQAYSLNNCGALCTTNS